MKKTNNQKPALLVDVKISKWEGRKLDKEATESTQKTFGAESGTGNYRKKVLPDAEQLQNVITAAGRLRDFVNRETLPWLRDGTRILSAANYLNFVTQFRAERSKFETAVADFLAAYPNLLADAQKKLGAMYRPEDYPDVSQLSRKFRCEIDFLPMPDASDFRMEITDAEKSAFEAKVMETQSKAMRDCWERLHGVVKTAAEKLADPNAKFRESLISNITEICGLLPRLNFADDPQLEAERVRVEQLAARLSADTLRVNATERKTAADTLREMESKMTAIMGPMPKKTEDN